jgi:transcriptional regulator with XRE-family HTH domain
MSTLAENLKRERQRAGVSRDEAAAHVEKSNGMISHWETGRYEPTISDLRKLAKLYGCSMTVLLGENDLIDQLKGKVQQLEAVVDYFRGKDSLGKPVEHSKTASELCAPPFIFAYRGQNRVQMAGT